MGAGGDAGLRGKAGLGGLEALAPRRCQCVCRGSCALGPRCTLRLPPPPPPLPPPIAPSLPAALPSTAEPPRAAWTTAPPHVGLRVRARQSRPSAAPPPPPSPPPPSPELFALRPLTSIPRPQARLVPGRRSCARAPTVSAGASPGRRGPPPGRPCGRRWARRDGADAARGRDGRSSRGRGGGGEGGGGERALHRRCRRRPGRRQNRAVRPAGPAGPDLTRGRRDRGLRSRGQERRTGLG